MSLVSSALTPYAASTLTTSTPSAITPVPASISATSPVRGISRFSYRPLDFSHLSFAALNSRINELTNQMQTQRSMWNVNLRPANHKVLADHFISAQRAVVIGYKDEISTLYLEFAKRGSSIPGEKISRINELMEDLQSQMNKYTDICARNNSVVSEVKGMPASSSVRTSLSSLVSLPPSIEEEIKQSTADLCAVLQQSQDWLERTPPPNPIFSTNINQAIGDFEIMAANKKADLTLRFGSAIISKSPAMLALEDLVHQTKRQLDHWNKAAEEIEMQPGSTLEGESARVEPKEEYKKTIPASVQGHETHSDRDEPGATNSGSNEPGTPSP